MDRIALVEEDVRALVGIERENVGSPLQRRRMIKVRVTQHSRY
jgi:hypothetical protein